MKKLIKSYRFWTALAGSLGLLVVSVAKLFGYSMSSVVVEELVMAVCGVLVVLGIVKKPEAQETTEESKQELPNSQTEQNNMVEPSKQDEEQNGTTAPSKQDEEQDIDKIQE